MPWYSHYCWSPPCAASVAGMVFLLLLTAAVWPRHAVSHAVPQAYVYPPPSAAFPSSQLYSANVTFAGEQPPQPLFVFQNTDARRRALDGATYNNPGQSVSFTGFAFSMGPVIVTVAASFDFSGCILRPSSLGLACSVIGPRVASFALAAPAKVSVELLSAAIGNDALQIKQPLFVFADPPEDPKLVPVSGARGGRGCAPIEPGAALGIVCAADTCA